MILNLNEADYAFNQEEVETAWREYISSQDWGSGEDLIKITDEMFWEFVEDLRNGSR
jgi:hypothetical protein